MKCLQCGAEVPPERMTCAQCGAFVAGGNAQNLNQQGYNGGQNIRSSAADWRSSSIVTNVLPLVAVGLIFLSLLFGFSEEENLILGILMGLNACAGLLCAVVGLFGKFGDSTGLAKVVLLRIGCVIAMIWHILFMFASIMMISIEL